MTTIPSSISSPPISPLKKAFNGEHRIDIAYKPSRLLHSKNSDHGRYFRGAKGDDDVFTALE